MQSLPVGRRIGAVNRVGVVESIVTPWNELRDEEGDVSVGVAIDRVVRGIGFELHRFHEGRVVASFRQQVRLTQCLNGLLHQRDTDPAPILCLDHGPMVSAVHRESPDCELSVPVAVGNTYSRDPDWSLLVSVPIVIASALVYD